MKAKFFLLIITVLISPIFSFASTTESDLSGAGIGAGIAAVGASIGIGIIGAYAMTAISRQPSAEPKIRPNMIVMAALIEGISLFALVVCLLIVFK
jgi:F-type H+-transporting ATPase subunit c